MSGAQPTNLHAGKEPESPVLSGVGPYHLEAVARGRDMEYCSLQPH